MATSNFEISYADSCNAEEAQYIGWSLDVDKVNGQDSTDIKNNLYRVVMRVETEQLYDKISDISQLNSLVNTSSAISLTLNGSNILSFTTAGTGYTQWMLESEAVNALTPYGCGLMSARRTYSSYGPWSSFPYTYVEDPSRYGLLCSSANITGAWHDSIEYSYITKESDNEQGDEEPEELGEILQTEERTKTLKIHTSEIYEDITAITIPSKDVPYVHWAKGMFNWTSSSAKFVYDPNHAVPPLSRSDFPYTPYLIMDGQDLVPESKKGGKFMKLTTHYGTQGMLQTREIEADLDE